MKHESKTHQPMLQDDLKRIKGIGPITERRLHKAGINSLASLAKLSSSSLTSLVPNLSAKQPVIQDWINQAKKLVPNTGDESLKQDSLSTPSQQRYATFNLELLLDKSNRVRRTQIVHVQSGEKNQWAAWDESRLISYIAQQSHIKIPTSPKQLPSIQGKIIESPQLQDSSLQKTAIDKSLIQDIPLVSIQWNKITLLPRTDAINMQVEFRLTGSQAMDIACKHSRYFLEILACDLITAHLVVLTSIEGMLQADQLDYALSLEFSPPKLGRYQLEIILLLPEDDAVAIQLGPLLTVVP